MTELGQPIDRGTPGPWESSDAVALFAFQAVGIGMVLAAWYGSSVTTGPFDQVVWLIVGVLGSIVSAFGGLVWLLNGRRRVGERFWLVAGAIPTGRPAELRSAQGDTGLPVAIDGTSTYHRPSCLLVVGKTTRSMSESEHRGAGRAPCRMCSP